jgi:endo-1,4-beta-xylanase
MKKKIIPILSLALLAGISACEPDPVHILDKGNFDDTNGPLKDHAEFPIGMAIEYDRYLNDDTYRQTVTSESKSVTFGNEMKHYAIVTSDGSLNFTRADALYAAAESDGLEVFGHTLGWHSNQNGAYLKTIVGGGTGPTPVNVLANGTFEAGSGSTFTNWAVYNTNGATFTAGSTANEIHGGARSVVITNPTANPGNQWRVQFASDLFPTTIGKVYRVTFWMKAAVAGGSGRLSTQPTASYQGDTSIGTDWSLVTWNFTAQDAQTRILFDMGQAANTYYLDDVSVVDASSANPPAGDELIEAVTNAMDEFITGTVTHYKGKVKAWDVVNEAMADGSSGLRTNANTTVAAGATDVFFWSQYLGRDWALKAFQFAEAADPDALLFINDYNLEINNAKLDSLINYVNQLKAKGAKIDGIGTQMHIGINTSYAGIDNAFRKLAATGLKVRISELDVRANPTDKPNFNAAINPNALSYQAVMYNYVVKSYLENVPAAQRHGITFWGVSDEDSWIVNVLDKIDVPLLFDVDYNKKPAYGGVLQALKEQN